MEKGNRNLSLSRNFDNGGSVVKIGKKEALYFARFWPFLSPNFRILTTDGLELFLYAVVKIP
jgi:hypothetical protein